MCTHQLLWLPIDAHMHSVSEVIRSGFVKVLLPDVVPEKIPA